MATSTSKATTSDEWRVLTPEHRLSHLSTFPCIASESRISRILDDLIKTSKASIPFLTHADTPKTSGVRVIKTYQPVSKVVIVTRSSNPETILAYAIAPLLAGCAVVLPTPNPVPKYFSACLRAMITFTDDQHAALEGAGAVLVAGSRKLVTDTKNAMSGKRVHFCEFTFDNLACILYDTAHVSQTVEAVTMALEYRDVNVSVYVYQGVCDQLKDELRRSNIAYSNTKLNDALKEGSTPVSVVEIPSLDEAVATVNNGEYDVVSLFGEAVAISHAAKQIKAPYTAMNASLSVVPLLTQGAEYIRQFIAPRSLLMREEGQLAIMKQYMVGRFDNRGQIAAERATGEQRTAFAVQINGLIDDKIEGGPQEGVFHTLNETFKYAPGQRNPQVVPLILRFEYIKGRVGLTSIRIPEGLDLASLRNDNPVLCFKKEELRPSKSFPEQLLYTYDKELKEFSVDVHARRGPDTVFHLCETLARDRLTVSEHLWIGDRLKDGFYEQPFFYERVYTT